MIYFVANNGYHLFDMSLHLIELSSREVTLLLVEHTIDSCTIPSSLARVVSIDRVPIERGKVRALVYARSLPHKIRNKIKPSVHDTLFMYTEFELANQIIAHVFKAAGARVYLIEDGGFGTYLPFRYPESEKLNVRELLQQAYERLMPGLRRSRIHKVNGERFRAMEDSLFTGLLLYRNVEVSRQIPRHIISRPPSIQLSGADKNAVLFLNEPIYQHYQPFERYISDLKLVIEVLQKQFTRVHFKFHPRESPSRRDEIRQALGDSRTLEYVRSNLPIEFCIEECKAGFACSYISTALLNLCQFGVEPIFIYQLLPDLKSEPIFSRATQALEQLGYRFPHAWDQVNPGFLSGLCIEASTHGTRVLSEFAGSMDS